MKAKILSKRNTCILDIITERNYWRNAMNNVTNGTIIGDMQLFHRAVSLSIELT